MSDDASSSMLTKFFALLVFGSLTVASFGWFFWSVTKLVSELLVSNSAVIFEKGVMYTFGIGIVLLMLTFSGIYEGILQRAFSDRAMKIVTRSMIAGLIVMFILPQIVHHYVGNYLDEQGYSICAEASYRWLHHQEIAYVSTPEACLELVKKKEEIRNKELF